MTRPRRALGVLACALAIAGPTRALAQDHASDAPGEPTRDAVVADSMPRTASFVLGLGAAHLRAVNPATTVRAEYRHGDVLPWRVQPFAGVDAGGDHSVYVYVGVLRALGIGSRVRLTPSVGVGYFDHGTFVLGYPIEFRSGFEVSVRLVDALEVGAAWHHVSNGGLGRLNPGSEQLVLLSTLSLPRR